MGNSVKLAGICPLMAEKVSVLTCTGEEEHYNGLMINKGSQNTTIFVNTIIQQLHVSA
jgi:hypothetical protein